MMKHRLYILPILLLLCVVPNMAHAGLLGDAVNIVIDAIMGGSAMEKLTDNIVKMAEEINEASSQMMKLGDMLVCSAWYGSAADVSLTLLGVDIFTLKLVAPSILLSGGILYIVGFFILMIASFYMFDVAFNLSISIILLPLALALWPFGVTKGKLKDVISSITYYVGVFIFLPLGILIAKSLVLAVADEALSGTGFDFEKAYFEDKSDLIVDNLGLFTLGFLKMLLCYVIAIRLIPLMANDFCNHFFSGPLAGSPLSNRITQLQQMAMKQGKKVMKYGKDVANHQTGKAIENKYKGKSGLGNAIMARFGRRVARTQRSR